jgi:flagellar motor switch protein FliN/FliY
MSGFIARIPDGALSEGDETVGLSSGLSGIDSALFREVRVALQVRLGEAAMTVGEMLALKNGAVVPLNTGLADHVSLYLNEMLVARGEIVAVGDTYAIKIVGVAAKS